MEGGYLPFLAKGMLAITVLLNSFKQTALSVSVGRFYFHTLQTILVSPVPALQAVIGITLAGVILSALCFGALGIAVALWVEHPDALSLVINCILTPMTFFAVPFSR